VGDRYILDSVTCPRCDHIDWDCYYAPSCDFINHTCSECGYIIDLEEYTGITREDCSNTDEIKKIVEDYDDKKGS
jgi:hypothetical protein